MIPERLAEIRAMARRDLTKVGSDAPLILLLLDEIDALRAATTGEGQKALVLQNHELAVKCDALRARCERLEAALQGLYAAHGTKATFACKSCMDARAALAPASHQEER